MVISKQTFSQDRRSLSFLGGERTAVHGKEAHDPLWHWVSTQCCGSHLICIMSPQLVITESRQCHELLQNIYIQPFSRKGKAI